MQNLIQIVMQKCGIAAERGVINRNTLLLTTSSLMAMLLVGCDGENALSPGTNNQVPIIGDGVQGGENSNDEGSYFVLSVSASDADGDSLTFRLDDYTVWGTEISKVVKEAGGSESEIYIGETIAMSSLSGWNYQNVTLYFYTASSKPAAGDDGAALGASFTVTDGEGGKDTGDYLICWDLCDSIDYTYSINYSTAPSQIIIEDILEKNGTNLAAIKYAILLATAYGEGASGHEANAFTISEEDGYGNTVEATFQYSDDVFIVDLRVEDESGGLINSSVVIIEDNGVYIYVDRDVVIEDQSVVIHCDDLSEWDGNSSSIKFIHDVGAAGDSAFYEIGFGSSTRISDGVTLSYGDFYDNDVFVEIGDLELDFKLYFHESKNPEEANRDSNKTGTESYYDAATSQWLALSEREIIENIFVGDRLEVITNAYQSEYDSLPITFTFSMPDGFSCDV
jgi:hypothetical protein